MSLNSNTPESLLLERLRSGDETAFASLVDGLHGNLISFARTFTSSATLAEDIVQETWIGVIRGLHAFDGRSSLRTWIFSILVRRARTVAGKLANASRFRKHLTRRARSGHHSHPHASTLRA